MYVGNSKGTVLGDVGSPELEVSRPIWGREHQGPCKPAIPSAAAVVKDTLEQGLCKQS